MSVIRRRWHFTGNVQGVVATLDRRLTPQPHDNMYSDMYEYSFRKVL